MNINNGTSRIYSLENKTDTNKNPQIGAMISKKTQDLLSRIQSSDTEGILYFIDKNTTPIKLSTDKAKAYHYENVLFVRSDGETSSELEDTLKMFQGFNSVPKFAKFYKLGDNDYLSVLELDKDDVLSYKQAASAIPMITRQNFKKEISDMTKNNIYCRELFVNKNAYFVSKDLENIIFVDWFNIKRLPDSQKQQMLENIKNWKF